MKNKKLVVIAVIMLMTVSLTKTNAQNNFRNSKWGMNQSTVKSVETSKLIHEESTKIIYDCPLAKIDGKLIYTFSLSGKLMRAKYLLTPSYINVNFFIRDYKLFHELLSHKYGKEAGISIVTVNKQTLVENEWPANLLTGNLRMETKWNIDGVIILLTLSKIEEILTIQIDYISIKYSESDYNEKKAKIIKDL